jgi:GntR family transcriptional regulator
MLGMFHIDANGIPIYIQIREQLLAAIASGALKPGERLPTMREVAATLRVNLNTVRHAYDSARESGAIVLVRARGTYVAEPPPEIAGDAVDRLAQNTAIAAYKQGISLNKLIERLNQIATSHQAEGGPS